jgi:hypothetical protein
VLLVPIFLMSQGTSCTTPIAIALDGVCRNYTISSSTGANLVCTSSGTTPVTYFSITSNSSAQNMLLKITGPSNQPVEVAFYHGTSCTNGNLEAESSICLYDGNGDWAPAEDFVITPNTTYIVRIKTATTGTIQICGQYYTPPNNNCLGATPIGTELLVDNNAAHKPGNGVNPFNVCADVLENTAFYTYIVDITGPTSLSVETMNCDNNYESDLLKLGFQIGFFTGTCSGLTPIKCYAGVNGSAQLTVGVLPTGTQVYVLIDGILGSNCDYSIRAINALVLAASLKYFTAWKTPEGNLLKWVSLKEYDNAFFEVQRSTDGINFTTIDRIAGQGNSTVEKTYQYIDASPPSKSYYRLKMITADGQNSYSNILRVERGSKGNPKITFNNVVTDQLSLQINDLKQEKVSIKIIDQSGREVYRQNTQIRSGYNLINLNTAKISSGIYYLIVSGVDYKEAFPFVKS